MLSGEGMSRQEKMNIAGRKEMDGRAGRRNWQRVTGTPVNPSFSPGITTRGVSHTVDIFREQYRSHVPP